MRYTTLALLAMLAIASADVYLHTPRGANDRCDEKSNNRNNDERLYNSQNNAAGGYAICDQEMFYYTDTALHIEWYSQHSCGNGAVDKANPNNQEINECEHVIQVGCEDSFKMFINPATSDYYLTDGVSLGRPGADRPSELNGNDENYYNTFGDTCTQKRPLTLDGPTGSGVTADCPNGFTENDNTCNNLDLSNGGNRGTFNGNTCECSSRKAKTYGLHEPEVYWHQCRARERNKGLFTANQNVGNKGATNSRQQPNSDRYGFECPEERDYWPYWHPTPWKDLAVFVSNTSSCAMYQAESQNVKDKCHCVYTDEATATWQQNLTAWNFNNRFDCEDAGMKWRCYGKWNWEAPKCAQAANQADNRLGNVNSQGDLAAEDTDNSFAHYDWVIPEYAIPAGQDSVRCVIRLRYNISTAEIGFDFAAKDNSIARTNPVHSYGSPLSADEDTADAQDIADVIPIRMAINTAQYGRTFEDRTEVFEIRRRPSELVGKTIHNLNVRGKRGNIAQVRNCLEYDFSPITLKAAAGDMIHVQFCGSDYNDNGNAGEGRAGTDRSNIVEIKDFAANLPLPRNQTTGVFSTQDLSTLAWLGQAATNCYTAKEMLTTKANQGNDPKSCHFLNGVRDDEGKPTGYFSEMVTVQQAGVFRYMSSRNNNFSNRSQKGVIIVGENTTSPGVIAGIVVGSVAGVALLAGGIFLVATKKVSFFKFSNRV